MNCNDVRARLDRMLPGEAREPGLTTHLAQCPECRAHADALALVDTRLTAMHARIAPPADFDVQLRARLAREAQRSQAAVDRESIEGELDHWLARLRRESWLDGAAIFGGAAALGTAAWHFVPEFVRLYSTGDSGPTALVVGALTAAAALGAGWLALGDARRTLLRR